MEVAGVDGCPGGWIVVWAQADRQLRLLSASIAPTFRDVLDRTKDCMTVGIDVPIGLMERGSREADGAARKALGKRASCVFPAVIRPALGIQDYRQACDASEAARGKRIPRQAFTLGLRSHEVDLLMTPALQQRIVEVHPEVCFWAMNGESTVMTKKRSPAGEGERLALLSAVYAGDIASDIPPSGAARDDLLDACAAAWTAARYARGEHGTLPPDPPTDRRGLRMQIVY
ncbi:MAG: DUF429 domain-containing protein [Dehalococcoidia bacterium]